MSDYVHIQIKAASLYAPHLEWEWLYYLLFACPDEHLEETVNSLTVQVFSEEIVRTFIDRAQKLFKNPDVPKTRTSVQQLLKKQFEASTASELPSPRLADTLAMLEQNGSYISLVGPKKLQSQLAQFALKRNILNQSEALLGMLEKGGSIEEVVQDIKKRRGALSFSFSEADEATRSLYLRATAAVWSQSEPLKNQIANTLKNIENPNKQIPSGIAPWDRAIGGFFKKEFYLIHGPSGVTKTGFIVNMAYNMAKQGKKAIIFTHEESVDRIIWRVLSRMTGISYSAIKKGELNEREWVEMAKASDELSKLPLEIVDGNGWTNNQIKDRCNELKSREEIGGIFIDSFAFINWGPLDIYQRAATAGQFFKMLAYEMDAPVIAICHNSTRGSREDGPTKYNVEGGEGLTRPAWVCVELRLDDKNAGFGTYAYVNAFITKNRDGPPNQVMKLTWDASQCVFMERK